jgi:hypothetical protein
MAEALEAFVFAPRRAIPKHVALVAKSPLAAYPVLQKVNLALGPESSGWRSVGRLLFTDGHANAMPRPHRHRRRRATVMPRPQIFRGLNLRRGEPGFPDARRRSRLEIFLSSFMQNDLALRFA